ncbi:MAG: ATP-dependent helicase HrpB [Rhodospirillaceae bacterium]|nr:ATP-dependent helicase HrpB [Rhodospirillaceae bacterium]
MTQPLPIDSLIPEIKATLAERTAAVVVAAPGAGKTTRVPLAILDEPWVRGRSIVMLEPRRLAARMAAERMASEIGQSVGETVGYRVRLEAKVSRATRIEVVTEGILNRRLQHDPELAGTAAIIFDEFHERSLDTDLGLALVLDVQRNLRPDLRVLIMSATLDAAPVAKLIGDAPVLESVHRPFPVETRYLPKSPGGPLDKDMTALIRTALDDEEGSVLAFLPGEAEIRRVASALAQSNLPPQVEIRPLYGALPWKEQNAAVAPSAPGTRKVVLATTIAETSLTIEGVRIVVDCGRKRVSRFDPARGMAQLVTVPVSRASAEQRRGRAGRLGPGVCYRLWTEAEDRALVAFDQPEIAVADLAPLALDLANWGVADPGTLSWLTPPGTAAFQQGVDLLKSLGALDTVGRITAEGCAMAALPLHPRLAHLVHRGIELGAGATACDLAALLADRDIVMGTRDPDLRMRVDILARDQAARGAVQINRGALERVRASAKQIRSIAKADPSSHDAARTGVLTALAYPDRIAQRRGARGRYRMAGGGGAVIDETQPLAAEDYLAIAHLDGAAKDARIYLAAPITQADIEEVFADQIAETDVITWDTQAAAVVAARQSRLGALILEDKPLAKPDPERVTAAFLDGVRAMGLGALPWSDAARGFQTRVAFVRGLAVDDDWPDLSDAGLLANLETWLAPYVIGLMRRAHLSRLDLLEVLRAQLSWAQQKRLDELAPTHMEVPSGSHIRIEYTADGGPSMMVKLQEVFGLTETPAVGGGRVPVRLHLLSPAQRPIAVTADLKSFWANAYAQVRAEMRGRYPRHNWPENPLTAVASRKSLKQR